MMLTKIVKNKKTFVDVAFLFIIQMHVFIKNGQDLCQKGEL